MEAFKTLITSLHFQTLQIQLKFWNVDLSLILHIFCYSFDRSTRCIGRFSHLS